MTTIKIDDADAPTLRAYAETMGLDAKPGHNRNQLIALIHRADSEIKEIPAPKDDETQAVDLTQSQAAPIIPPAPGPAVERGGAGGLMPHFSTDPKVELTVMKSSDTTRAKDVTIAVNGDVFRIQRGQRVAVPYRVYLALEDAKEMQAVDTGEERMGVPVREWQEVYSYPFVVHGALPSDDVVADWRARTDGAVASASRSRAA